MQLLLLLRMLLLWMLLLRTLLLRMLLLRMLLQLLMRHGRNHQMLLMRERNSHRWRRRYLLLHLHVLLQAHHMHLKLLRGWRLREPAVHRCQRGSTLHLPHHKHRKLLRGCRRLRKHRRRPRRRQERVILRVHARGHPRGRRWHDPKLTTVRVVRVPRVNIRVWRLTRKGWWCADR